MLEFGLICFFIEINTNKNTVASSVGQDQLVSLMMLKKP